jgi:AraC-like DNA-binding protein
MPECSSQLLELTPLPVSVPGLRATRTTATALLEGVKDYYAIGRVERGKSEWWGGGRAWLCEPGSVQVKQPGDVHRDLRRDGPMTWVVIALPTEDVEHARDGNKALAYPQLAADDARAAPFHRLHDAVCAKAERLALEVAVAEAIAAFALLSRREPNHSRPVRRALEYLQEHLVEPITLDDLALRAGLDKFHLCRAFRAQVGMPPHAYLTRLRILRAKRLLQSGLRASEVAAQVGLYDQAQLTRHFRRIVGVTPARYGRGYRTTQAVPASTGHGFARSPAIQLSWRPSK